MFLVSFSAYVVYGCNILNTFMNNQVETHLPMSFLHIKLIILAVDF